MPARDEVEAVAVLLRGSEAARAAVSLWQAGEAVVPLDPAAPAPDVRRSLAALRPTAVIDGDGWHRLPGGVPAANGVAAIVATSGTTGERKGVELTFAGLAASGKAVGAAVGDARRAGEAGAWLCCLPLHHVAGLAVVGRAWTTGAPWIAHDRFDPAAVADAARAGSGAGRTRAAFVSLVPTMLRRLLDGAPGVVAAFQHILLGGGPIDAGLLARARAAGATVSTTYGMTETWGGIVHDGHPLPGVELRLDTDADVAEILVRAPMLMRGYRLWPEGTAAAVDADGWYRTGDLGRFDPGAGGRLWVVDRVGDVINTGGVKVSPAELEAVLAAHPGVADVCVTGAPDADWGERVVAFVVPARAGEPPTLAELRSYAGDHLPASKLPREILVLEAVPRTAGGKPLRRLLREMAGRDGSLGSRLPGESSGSSG